jgi:hypothetical protein
MLVLSGDVGRSVSAAGSYAGGNDAAILRIRSRRCCEKPAPLLVIAYIGKRPLGKNIVHFCDLARATGILTAHGITSADILDNRIRETSAKGVALR